MKSMIEIHENSIQILHSWRGFCVIEDILEEFSELEIFLTGGVLRNIIIGKKQPPNDFDFFIGGKDIDNALNRLKRQGRLEKGPYGSPRWFPPNHDACYCDLVPINSFYNGLWYCEDIIDVLNQFDFTGNAIAINLRTKQFYDPQNGKRDLELGIIKAVRFDYPEEPISQNITITRPAVVWFRILHYAALLSLRIEPVTYNWLIKEYRFKEYEQEFNENLFPLHINALDLIK